MSKDINQEKEEFCGKKKKKFAVHAPIMAKTKPSSTKSAVT